MSGSNPITASDLLTGSNESLSVYTGGYQATDFNDPIQDYITQHMIRSSGGKIIPNIDLYSYGGEGAVKASSVYGKSYYSKLGVFTFLEGGAWGLGAVSASYEFYDGILKKYFHSSAPAFKALKVLGRASGAYSVYDHYSKAATEYGKHGLSRQFYIDAGRTAVDFAFFMYTRSNPVILAGSVLFSIGDTYYEMHFRKK